MNGLFKCRQTIYSWHNWTAVHCLVRFLKKAKFSWVSQNRQWYATDFPKQKRPKVNLKWERKSLFSGNCFCSPDLFLGAFIEEYPKGCVPAKTFFRGFKYEVRKKVNKDVSCILASFGVYFLQVRKIDLLVRIVRPFNHHSVLCIFSAKKELFGAYPGRLMHSNISNAFNVLMQYRISFCKRPLDLNCSLTQRKLKFSSFPDWQTNSGNDRWSISTWTLENNSQKMKISALTWDHGLDYHDLKWERKILFSGNCFRWPDWFLDAFIIRSPTNRT